MRRAIALAIIGLMLLPLPGAAQSSSASPGQSGMSQCSSEQMMPMADMMGDMQHQMTMMNEMMDQMKQDMRMGTDMPMSDLGAGSGIGMGDRSDMGNMNGAMPTGDIMAEHMAMMAAMMEQMRDEMNMMASMHEMMDCSAMPGRMEV